MLIRIQIRLLFNADPDPALKFFLILKITGMAVSYEELSGIEKYKKTVQK